MPAKGSKYATIDVDLQRWGKDEIARTGEKPAHLARRLGVERARVHELLSNKLNTMNMLEIIVGTTLKGDYTQMAKYAKTDTGLEVLKDLHFKQKLSPYQRDVYKQLDDAIRKKILEDPDEAKKLLGMIES